MFNIFPKEIEDIILSYKAQLEHTESYKHIIKELKNHEIYQLTRKHLQCFVSSLDS